MKTIDEIQSFSFNFFSVGFDRKKDIFIEENKIARP
jgi:hypothetical protein